MVRDAQFWLRIAVALFLCLVVYYVPWLVVPFVLALFLTLLLRPLVNGIMRGVGRLGWKWFPVDLAIIIAFLVFILVMVLIVNRIMVPFLTEFQLFLAQVPQMTDQAIAVAGSLQNQWMEWIPADVQVMIKDLAIKTGNYLVEIAKTGVFAVLQFTSTLVELIVVPIISFYMLKSGGKFKRVFVGLFPVRYQAHLTKVIEEMDFTLSAYVKGQLLMCCLIAILVFLGMWFFGVPYPLVIALLAGIVELVPIVGPIIGAIPAVLLGATVSFSLAVKVLIFYIVVQQFEGHLLMPNLMGNVINIHPVTIIAGVLIGSATLGVFGMMLAVPVLSVLKVCGRHLWYYNKYRDLAKI